MAELWQTCLRCGGEGQNYDPPGPCGFCQPGPPGVVRVPDRALLIEDPEQAATRMKESLSTDIFAVFGNTEPRANLASRDIWLSIIASNALRAAVGEGEG